MAGSVVTDVAIPVSMAILMIGVGTTVGPSEIRQEWTEPRVFLAGLASQLVALPALATGLLWLLRPDPALAAGVLLVAVCPGGVFSNLTAHLARGRVALSVALTATSTLLAMVTIPLWTSAVSAALQLPIPQGSVVGALPKLALITTGPVLLGMALRAARPRWTERLQRPFGVASALFLVGVAVLIGLGRRVELTAAIAAIGPTALLLSIGSTLLGAAIAIAVRSDRRGVITISLETGVQNAGLAMTIALSGFAEDIRDTVALPAMLYLLLTFLPAAALITVGRLLIPVNPPSPGA